MAIKSETVVTRYEVVTINHEQGVDRIRAKQKQLELQLKDWNDEAKRTEKIHSDAWKTVGLAIAGVGLAVVAGKASFDEYAKSQRLATASGYADIEKLSQAAGGLQTRMELLEFAAKANHGAFKLSTEQMVIAQQAIRELTRRGYDQEEVTKKVTDAVVGLKTDGLKDLGLHIRSTTSDTEKFNVMYAELALTAAQGAGATTTGAESIQQLGVRFEDTFSKIKISMGEVVVSMGPLIGAVATLAEKTAGLMSTVADGWGGIIDVLGVAATHPWSGPSTDEKRKFYARFGRDYEDSTGGAAANDNYSQFRAAGGEDSNMISAGISSSRGSDALSGRSSSTVGDDTLAQMIKARDAKNKRLRELGGEPDKGPSAADVEKRVQALANAEAVRVLSTWLQQEGDNVAVTSGESRFAGARFASTSTGIGGFGGGGLGALADSTPRDEYGRAIELDTQGALTGKLTQNWQDRIAANENASKGPTGIKGVQNSYLENTFGKLADFNAYKMAFDSLAGATTSALGAWIDGSKSAGDAFKGFIKGALSGLASQMLVESLKHAAYALGSLAFGDFGGAARHGAAAAAFGVGAFAAAAAAKAMGGGSSTSAGAAAGAGGGSGPIATTSSGGSGRGDAGVKVIVWSGDIASQSQRMRQIRASELVDLAYGNPGSGVEYR